MKNKGPEPGFVQAYRLFSVVRIVFWIVIGPILLVFQVAANPGLLPAEVADMDLVGRFTLPNVAPVLVVELLLLVLLMAPGLPRRLGGWFVPLTVLIGLVPLLVGFYWWPSENPLQTPFVMFFFVMLVLIAWEYVYRYVLVYVFGLTLFQAWLSTSPPNVPWTVELGWLVLQAAMMLLVGYVTATFVMVQREQRSALADAYEKQAAATRRLQRYTGTLEELATIRERNRLARELHDTLAHSLSAVIVQLEAVRALWGVTPDKARTLLDQADETARTGLTEARRVLQALRASPLQDLGLSLAVRELAETAAQRSGAALELHLSDALGDDLSPGVEQGVYRIAQEMLDNVARHAGATAIRVSLDGKEGRLELVVEDNGQGLDRESMRAGQAEGLDSYGIRGMQERAALLRGTLGISSSPGQGTRASLSVPV